MTNNKDNYSLLSPGSYFYSFRKTVLDSLSVAMKIQVLINHNHRLYC